MSVATQNLFWNLCSYQEFSVVSFNFMGAWAILIGISAKAHSIDCNVSVPPTFSTDFFLLIAHIVETRILNHIQ